MTPCFTPVKAFRAIPSNDLTLCPVARSAVDNAAARGRRGQRCALPTDRPPPADALPTAPLHRGARPPEPPAALRAAQLFEISQKPENRQGLGVGHGQPQAVAHPRHRRTRARNPSGWMTEAAGARCAKARQGAQPRGSGGASPLPRSALGAGRRPGGKAAKQAPLLDPPLGVSIWFPDAHMKI